MAAPADREKPKCRLVGENGNAFAIMGRVTRALKSAGYSPEEIAQFREEATSGDYIHLLNVCDEWVEDVGEDQVEDDQ